MSVEAAQASGPLGRPLWAVPEVTVAFLSFVLHFVWEFLQVPTYADMATMAHWDGVKLCTSATFGDVGFALTAFWTASAVARTRHWLERPSLAHILVFLAVGIALTVGFEYYYTNVALRWTYSELMPLLPPFGTGMSPLLQWIVIPLLVVSLGGHVMRSARLPR